MFQLLSQTLFFIVSTFSFNHFFVYEGQTDDDDLFHQDYKDQKKAEFLERDEEDRLSVVQ